MAIDPGISLGIRPPQIAPLQIQTPLDRYQKMLTLRHLMTQGQLGTLNLEQTRLENEALREKGVQQREQTARAAQFRQRASQLQPGESVAPGEAYGLLGPEEGGNLLRTQAQQQLFENNLAIQQLEKLQAAAAASTDQASLTRNVMQLINAKVLPWQMGRDILKAPYDRKAIDEFGMAALNKKDQLLARNAQLEQEHRATMRPLEVQEAQQKVSGTTPISLQQTAEAKRQLWTTPGGLTSIIKDPNSTAADVARAKEQLDLLAGYHSVASPPLGPISPERLAQDIDKAVRISKLTGEGPKAVRAEIRAQGIGTQWQQSSKLLERYRVASSGYDSVKQMIGGGGPQDLAVVYGFAKAMDPESVVRESEVENAMKTGNIFRGALARFNGLWDPRGGFLSPEVKKDFLSAIRTRMESTRKQVFAEHGEIKRQQEVISPGSSEALYNPSVLDPEEFKTPSGNRKSLDQIFK